MAAHSQFQLVRERRFGPFFVTQFLGAFNDNVFKNALVILIAFQVAQSSDMSASTLVNLAAGLFILPFFLFSATGGQFADKYEKSMLIRRIKAAEIAIMCLGALGFFLQDIYMLLGVLFLMGAQSSFFGPVKYGILPQHLATDELVGGNAMVEMGTFVAILGGTILGGILIAQGALGSTLVSVTVIAVAVAGWFVSRGVPVASPVDPRLRVNWNLFVETGRILRHAHGNLVVFRAILGISWFWFYGAVVLAQIPNYTRDVLLGTETVVTLLLAVFSMGIGIGSLLCERMSGKRIEIGLVPFGAIGLTLFGVDLAFAHPELQRTELVGVAGFLGAAGSWRVLFDLLALAMFGGFYIVPLYALVQSRSEPSHRSRIIAGNNILNALFMVVAAAVSILFLSLGFTIPQLFLVVALFNAAVAVYIFALVPEFLMRFLVWLLMHTMYRLDEEGLDNIPDEGAAVLVCNHVSFVDALIITAGCRRPVRFVMDYRIYRIPVLNFVFRTGGAIPIASARDDPALLEQAYDRIAAYLDDGEVVCIFPEGRITEDGEFGEFKRGVERIVARSPVTVVPLALRGLWGSFFSREGGAAMRGFPRRFWSRVALVAGAPMAPGDVTAPGLQAAVAGLRGDRK